MSLPGQPDTRRLTMTRTSFTQPIHAPAPGVAALLDAERLDVFHVAVAFHQLVPALGRRAGRSLRDQLERASASITLNLCEGCARRSPGDKAISLPFHAGVRRNAPPSSICSCRAASSMGSRPAAGDRCCAGDQHADRARAALSQARLRSSFVSIWMMRTTSVRARRHSSAGASPRTRSTSTTAAHSVAEPRLMT